jgi:hypothetical protein
MPEIVPQIARILLIIWLGSNILAWLYITLKLNLFHRENSLENTKDFILVTLSPKAFMTAPLFVIVLGMQAVYYLVVGLSSLLKPKV